MDFWFVDSVREKKFLVERLMLSLVRRRVTRTIVVSSVSCAIFYVDQQVNNRFDDAVHTESVLFASEHGRVSSLWHEPAAFDMPKRK